MNMAMVAVYSKSKVEMKQVPFLFRYRLDHDFKPIEHVQKQIQIQ